jgi:hypothetical protein
LKNEKKRRSACLNHDFYKIKKILKMMENHGNLENLMRIKVQTREKRQRPAASLRGTKQSGEVKKIEN